MSEVISKPYRVEFKKALINAIAAIIVGAVCLGVGFYYNSNNTNANQDTKINNLEKKSEKLENKIDHVEKETTPFRLRMVEKKVEELGYDMKDINKKVDDIKDLIIEIKTDSHE